MRKRVIYILLGVVSLLAATTCAVVAYARTSYTPPTLSAQMTPMPTAEPTATPEPTLAPTETPAPTEAPTPTPSPTPYISPVDFASLQAINPDIYAWLQVDGTNINYPVLQSANGDEYYLNRDSDGNYSANGSIFSQHTYNGTDFQDPVTVLYGHRMPSGEMFGSMMKYFSDATFFQEDHPLRIYTPETMYEYKVFAAVPYSNEHILYSHDFSNADEFNAFFTGVFDIQRFEAQFFPDRQPEPGDKVLILSTCLESNRSQRFLVMGSLVEPETNLNRSES